MGLAVAEYPTGLTVGGKTKNTVNQNLDQKSSGYELVVKPLFGRRIMFRDGYTVKQCDDRSEKI